MSSFQGGVVEIKEEEEEEDSSGLVFVRPEFSEGAMTVTTCLSVYSDTLGIRKKCHSKDCYCVPQTEQK